MGIKQLACVMTLWVIGKQCIPIPECGVSQGLISVKKLVDANSRDWRV